MDGGTDVRIKRRVKLAKVFLQLVSRFWSAFARQVVIIIISNGNRTEWSPIRSVIIRVITKSDDRAVGVRFVYHEYDYRPNWTT